MYSKKRTVLESYTLLYKTFKSGPYEGPLMVKGLNGAIYSTHADKPCENSNKISINCKRFKN